jgi:hypothetical protein
LSDVIDDELLQLSLSGAISGISDTLRALEKARIACRVPHDVVDRLVSDPLPSWEEARLLTARLAEQDLSPDDLDRLRVRAVRLEQLGAEPGRHRGPLYTMLRRFLELLPQEERVPRLLGYLESPRSQQRAMACGALRHESLTSEQVAVICSAIRSGGDGLTVVLAARHAAGLSNEDAIDLVLPRLDSAYWRSRVVEELLPRDDVDVAALARAWPLPVLWASARRQWREYLPVVASMLPTVEEDWHTLPIVAWALGKLGAASELESLDKRMRARHEWKLYHDILSSPAEGTGEAREPDASTAGPTTDGPDSRP